ncbi:MAG: WD40/YVTN/BNR-like repeat-containing protein [Chloroflexota bacterium]
MSEYLMSVGTDDGVIVLRRIPGNWEQVSTGLNGRRITALAHGPGRPCEIFAGSYGRGLYYSADGGVLWQARDAGLADTYVRSILVDPTDPSRVFVGTEPAAIFRSVDAGQTWQELTSIQQLPGHERWFLPYSPRAGAVRAIAAVPGLPGSLYAGIEQGGVISTYDYGDTWTLLDGGVDADVHDVLLAANGGVVVFAATGGGVYQSFDGGKTWGRVITDYTRALAQQPSHPALIFAGPALKVGHQGRVERSQDAGSTWSAWGYGLAVPLAGMVEQFVARSGTLDDLGGLFAVLSDGGIYHSPFDRPDWAPILCGGLPHANVVDVARG